MKRRCVLRFTPDPHTPEATHPTPLAQSNYLEWDCVVNGLFAVLPEGANSSQPLPQFDQQFDMFFIPGAAPRSAVHWALLALITALAWNNAFGAA